MNARRHQMKDIDKTQEVIKFYSDKAQYGYFSNFAAYPITVDGKIWPTTEHYFQAQKFPGTIHVTEIQEAKSPHLAAKLGRDRTKALRPDWEEVKEDIMRKALWAKFTQHPELKEKLITTKKAILIEHTTNDSYWADGGDGSGKNMLGILLMETREKLINID